MNKRLSLNIGACIALAIASMLIYYLLLRDTSLPLSITSVLHTFDRWIRHWHVLVVGIMPVYIALMIFGAGIIGMQLGNIVQQWVSQFLQDK